MFFSSRCSTGRTERPKHSSKLDKSLKKHKKGVFHQKIIVSDKLEKRPFRSLHKEFFLSKLFKNVNNKFFNCLSLARIIGVCRQ